MQIIVVGLGNAALCAAISAAEQGAKITILEAADKAHSGGNSKYTAGAMRFVYNNGEDLLPLLSDKTDSRLPDTIFGQYTKDKFEKDLLGFNGGRSLSFQQHILIDNSFSTISWLAEKGVPFSPIYNRQTFLKDGKHVFWGGLTLAAEGEGVGLVEAEIEIAKKMGVEIRYNHRATQLIYENQKISGIQYEVDGEENQMAADAVILGCGGFEANAQMRKDIMGQEWEDCLVRGTNYNQGAGIRMGMEIGAAFEGNPEGCHATPMDMHMPNYGNLEIPHNERKNYRKICYFLGVMLNTEGHRFVDEGINFRNYTYAQFGKAILNQPQGIAWQIFDQKVKDLLYGEYSFWDASYKEADTLEELIAQMDYIDKNQALKTLQDYNKAVDDATPFDPTILDGKGTSGLPVNKSNWANKLDTPPFLAYPVRCGITFTYGGLKINADAAVVKEDGSVIDGLYACGELVGGVFYEGYPGGSGLTSGAVFGRIAGRSASKKIMQ